MFLHDVGNNVPDYTVPKPGRLQYELLLTFSPRMTSCGGKINLVCTIFVDVSSVGLIVYPGE
jgi:hypothetical protein